MRAFRICNFLLLTFVVFAFGQEMRWQWHIVQKGETLYSLARQYRTTVKDIVRLNGWQSAKPLKVGEKIKVPIQPQRETSKPLTTHATHKESRKVSPPSLPPAKPKAVQVQVGKATVLTIRNLKSVSVANPEVADVQVLSPDHLGILGKSVGTTSLIIVADGRTYTLDVNVVPEPLLRERLLALIGIPTVQVEIVKGAIILSGTVSSQQEKERVSALARLFAATVLDLLKVEEPVKPIEVKPTLPSPEEIERAIGIEGVKVRLVGDSFVLEGIVDSQDEVSRAEKVAVLMAPKVVNLLQIRPMTSEEIQALIPIPTVKVRSMPEAIVVEGEVSSEEEFQKLNEIIAQVRKKVINWVKVVKPTPPAPPLQPSFNERVKEAIGIPTVEVKGDEKGLILMGKVATQAEKEKALRIARFMLGLPPVPPPTIPAPTAPTTPIMLTPLTGVTTTGLNPTGSNPAAPTQQPQILDLIEVKGGKQIRVELQVVEINRKALRNLGIEYPALSSPDPLQAPGIVFGQAENPQTGGVTGFAQRTPIRAVLQAMEQKNLARTLSAPSAVVLSGQESRFNVGGEIPIPVATVAPGVGTTTAVEFRPFGLVLSVIPTVEPNGKIRLTVSTEVSELDTTIAVNIGGALIPGTRIRKASTQVELSSGETLVMSGLVQRVHQEIVNKVPFLSKIPILGELFTSRKFQQGETELAILVTPTLIEPSE
ncbi:MAG: BON domain-containing protein [Armatimonadetes bacterium]|nr:BON domain-containing protein [Armatimonadota bacterium]MDW8027168.1 BON domain-containing protein [Armatimonadota bacterium]